MDLRLQSWPEPRRPALAAHVDLVALGYDGYAAEDGHGVVDDQSVGRVQQLSAGDKVDELGVVRQFDDVLLPAVSLDDARSRVGDFLCKLGRRRRKAQLDAARRVRVELELERVSAVRPREPGADHARDARRRLADGTIDVRDRPAIRESRRRCAS